jgi:hypothetical protein
VVRPGPKQQSPLVLAAKSSRYRRTYYDILEQTQKGSLDVTEWLAWLLDSLHRAVDQIHQRLDGVLIPEIVKVFAAVQAGAATQPNPVGRVRRAWHDVFLITQWVGTRRNPT